MRHDAESTRVDLATIRPNGTGLTVLTTNPANRASFAPDCAPDGSKVVFSQANGIGCNLATLSSSGRDRHDLPADGCIVDAGWGGGDGRD